MDRPEFVMYFREIRDKCGPLETELYGYIYWLVHLKNERCFASNETLADLCKSTTTSVGNALTALEKSGFIRRTYEDENPHKGRIEIIPLISFAKVSPTGDTRYHPQVRGVSPTGEQNKSNEKEQLIYSSDKEETPKRASYSERMGYPTERVKPVRKRGEAIVNHAFPNERAQDAAIAKCFRAGFTEEQIIGCFEALMDDPFWGEKGVDFLVVVSQIGKGKRTKKSNEAITSKYAKYAKAD